MRVIVTDTQKNYKVCKPAHPAGAPAAGAGPFFVRKSSMKVMESAGWPKPPDLPQGF